MTRARICMVVAALCACSKAPDNERPCLADDARGVFVDVPTGRFVLGAHAMYPEERAPEPALVIGFSLLAHEVTNDEFARFVEATGHRTVAEGGRGSAVFAHGRWRTDASATWRAPDGAGSTLVGRGSHPVVHVGLEDARAYAAWVGARLPTEVEWEYAASLGLFEPTRPDSGAIGPRGEARANIWNGPFPDEDTGADGFVGRAPAGCYPPSRIGTYDMLGNVWEWTASPFDAGRHTIKGGSYLCADSHCHRYRVPARQGHEDDFSSGHLGFRVVRDRSPIHDETP